jgi:hypothetical protein
MLVTYMSKIRTIYFNIDNYKTKNCMYIMPPDMACDDLPDLCQPQQGQRIHLWDGGTNTMIGKGQRKLNADSKTWQAPPVFFMFPKLNIWQRWKIWFDPKICIQVLLDQTWNRLNKRPVSYFETIWLPNINCKYLYNKGNLIRKLSTMIWSFHSK